MEGIRLEIDKKDINGTKVLEVVGEIDVYTAPQLKEAVNEIIVGGQKHLIVDMGSVTYMDSSGFGALLSATRRIRPEGGTINLVRCNKSIDRILKITKLDTVFSTFGNMDDAIKATQS